ncbi:MAG TPA: DddA-like double-stranded DNA deaminase toxin [Actinokineospora sp.]|jgi:hypothetical protein|nr:DddA-like double-stranded DNA deaminase toxin [Actinokineospora sp.]
MPTTPGEVAAALEQGSGHLPSVHVSAAHSAIEDARAALAPIAAESGQKDLHQAVEHLATAIAKLEQVQSAFTFVREVVAALIQRLVGPVASPPRSPTTAGRTGALFTKLPVRNATNRKTTGYWIDQTGKEHGPLVSGNDDYAVAAADLLRELGISPPRGYLATADHVETKLAAHIRGTGHRHITLVINNVPCRTGPFACDRLLPLLLAPGQAVTVYWPGGVKTFVGRAKQQ